MKKIYLLLAGLTCSLGSILGANLTIDGLNYSTLGDGSLKLNSIEQKTPQFIDISENVKYGFDSFNVTVIGSNVFKGNPYLTGVMLPETVTTIEYGAFNDCYMLRGITIPEGVKNIGYSDYYQRDIFEYTPIEVLSLMCTEVPKGNLSLIFESPYLRQIIVPAELVEAYEKAFPSIKEGRVKVSLKIEETISELAFRLCSSFNFISSISKYPVYIANSSAELPINAVIYTKPDADILLMNDGDLVAGGGECGIFINGEDKHWSYDGIYLPSNINAITESNTSKFYVQNLGSFKNDTSIEIKMIGSDVASLPADFPEMFDVYSLDGKLVLNKANIADLDTLSKNFYILKGAERTVKVIAGK